MCSNKTIQIDRFFWYFQWTLLDNVGTALVMSTKTYGSNGLDQIWEGFVEFKTFLSDFLIYEKKYWRFPIENSSNHRKTGQNIVLWNRMTKKKQNRQSYRPLSSDRVTIYVVCFLNWSSFDWVFDWAALKAKLHHFSIGIRLGLQRAKINERSYF